MIILHDMDIVDNGLKNVAISERKIIPAGEAGEHDAIHLFFDGAIAFPGLINSHDHLDFNLFPRTGNRIYNNYTEWGNDIHAANKHTIDAVLKIPQDLRVQWGMYKNLLNGITTVINHGEYLKIENPVIRVFQEYYTLHSVQFEKNWKLKLNQPLKKNLPFVIHAGEGTDNASHEEIDQLIKWNLFRRKLIAVHGVAMDEKQAGEFDGLVWCPGSNYFLLDKTAAIDKLKYKTRILFGMDSTLTAGWNLWEQLRLAETLGMADEKEIFKMLTYTAAEVWNMGDYGIETGCIANIVIAKRKAAEKWDAFFKINPEDILLAVGDGEIKLFDGSLYEQLQRAKFDIGTFSKIVIQDKIKFIRGNLPGLLKEIKTCYPEASFPVEADN